MPPLTLRGVPYRRVRVLWDDITGDGAWQPADKLVTPTRCLSVGWLIKEAPQYIVIAASLSHCADGTWDVADTNAIHRSAIAKLTFEDRRAAKSRKAPGPDTPVPEPKGDLP